MARSDVDKFLRLPYDKKGNIRMLIRTPRAPASGHRLSEADAALVKGMILRGDRQSDIAAHFCVNIGRIAEVNHGHKFASVVPEMRYLPPPGPYEGDDLVPLLRLACREKGKSYVALLLKTCVEGRP